MAPDRAVTWAELDEVLQAHMAGVHERTRAALVELLNESIGGLHSTDELLSKDVRKIMRDLYGEEPLNEGVIVTVQDARKVINKVRVAAELVRWVAPIVGAAGLMTFIDKVQSVVGL